MEWIESQKKNQIGYIELSKTSGFLLHVVWSDEDRPILVSVCQVDSRDRNFGSIDEKVQYIYPCLIFLRSCDQLRCRLILGRRTRSNVLYFLHSLMERAASRQEVMGSPLTDRAGVSIMRID